MRELEKSLRPGWISEEAISDAEMSLKFAAKKKNTTPHTYNETYNMITEVLCLRSLDSRPRGFDSVSPFLSSVKHYHIFC